MQMQLCVHLSQRECERKAECERSKGEKTGLTVNDLNEAEGEVRQEKRVAESKSS